MLLTPSLDRNRATIHKGDTVAFSDGSTVQVLAAACGSVVYQRDHHKEPVYCYSFLVERVAPCKLPASVEASAVVAQVADTQGASHV